MTLLIVAAIVWLAQSGIEWKLVKSNPWFTQNFTGVRGMVISGVISTLVTLVAGSTMGVEWAGAFALAGIVGLFTNEFTYKLFDGIEATHKGVKSIRAKITSNPQLTSDAKLGLQGVAKGAYGLLGLIGKLMRAVGWLCALPSNLLAAWRRMSPFHPAA